MSDVTIRSKFWDEEPESDNPFAAGACYCSGYDVYGEILLQATYLEYLFLLFRKERPTRAQVRILEVLAIALANPGPRHPAVHAAMGAGVSGSPAAAILMSALAVGAGASGGGREVFLAMHRWQRCGLSLEKWEMELRSPPSPTRMEIWPDCSHPAGFAPYGTSAPQPVRQTLAALGAQKDDSCSAWLTVNREPLEAVTGLPVSLPGVAAAALTDLGFTAAEGEMLFLLLQLPGAAVHAIEQHELGFRSFPFFSLDIANDPGPVAISED